MYIESALWRIARPTIACSSLELNIHLATSSVSPRHCTCTVSNIGVVGCAIFSVTDADAEVEVDAEDLVRVRECECVCGEIDVDRLLLAWLGGVVVGVGGMTSLLAGVGAVAVAGRGRLMVGLRGPMGKVRSRRENVETNEDAEFMGPLRDGTDLDILLPSADALVSAGILGRPEAGACSGATMVGCGAAVAAAGANGWGNLSSWVEHGLHERGVWGNMLSLRSLGGGRGGFVLIAGRTRLVLSIDPSDDVSDLLLLLLLLLFCFFFCGTPDEDAGAGDLTAAGRKLPMGSVAPEVDDSGRLGRRSNVFLAGTNVEAGGASLTLRVRKWPLNASEMVRECDVFADDDGGRSSGEGAAGAAGAGGAVVGAGGEVVGAGEVVEGLEVEPVPGVVPWWREYGDLPVAEAPNSDDGPVENDEDPVLVGSSCSPSPLRPRASSSSVLVYISRYCVSAVPGVAGAGAGLAAVVSALSLSLPAMSSSTAREGRSESVRRGERHVRVWEDAESPRSRGSARGSDASVSSAVLL